MTENHIVGRFALFEYESEEKALEDLKSAWEETMDEESYAKMPGIFRGLSGFGKKRVAEKQDSLLYGVQICDKVTEFPYETISLDRFRDKVVLRIEMNTADGNLYSDSWFPPSTNWALAKKIDEIRNNLPDCSDVFREIIKERIDEEERKKKGHKEHPGCDLE